MRKSDGWGLLCWLWVLYLTAIMSVLIGAAAPPIVAFIDNHRTSEWLGFYGNIVAGMMTIAAAAIAWFAVTMQINAQRELAAKPENEAFEAFCADLIDHCEWLNEIWRAIDYVLARNLPIEQALGRSAVVSAVVQSGGVLPVNQAREKIPYLNPTIKKLAEDVLFAIEIVDRDFKAVVQARDQRETLHNIRLAKIGLSHLHKYLQDLRPDLAALFDKRNKVTVNHGNAASHIRQFISESINRP